MRLVRTAMLFGLVTALGSLGNPGADAANVKAANPRTNKALTQSTTTKPATTPATTQPTTAKPTPTQPTTAKPTTRPTTAKPNGNNSSSTHHVASVTGIVEHVNHDKGLIRIHVHHNGQGGHHHEETFHVNSSTKFVKVHGQQHHKVHFHDVHHGEHVVIQHHSSHPHLASEVEIIIPGTNHPAQGNTAAAKAKTGTKLASVR